MLGRCWLASLLAIASQGHAAVITGAFGMEFGTPLPSALIGPPIAGAPPPAPFDWVLPDDAPADLRPAWFVVTPSAVPRVVDDVEGRFSVQLDRDGVPVRVVATFADACADKSAPLTAILARKYRQLPHSPESNESEAWFGDDELRAGVYCVDNVLVVDYVDVDRYRRWEAATRDRYAVLAEETREAQAAQALIEQEAQDQLRRLEEAEARRRADALAAAAERERLDSEAAAKAARRALVDGLLSESARRIDSVFGVPLRDPFTQVSGFTPDVPLPITRSGIAAPFDDGSYTLELDPEGTPITVRGTFVIDNAANVADDLALGLREKYGAPRKDNPRHRIFEIAGAFLVVKRTAADTLEVLAINQSALQLQRRRKNEATAALEADRARRFEQETRGL